MTDRRTRDLDERARIVLAGGDRFQAHPSPAVSDPPDSAVENMAAVTWAAALFLLIVLLSSWVPLGFGR